MSGIYTNRKSYGKLKNVCEYLVAAHEYLQVFIVFRSDFPGAFDVV